MNTHPCIVSFSQDVELKNMEAALEQFIFDNLTTSTFKTDVERSILDDVIARARKP
jgi:hypothetical protein